MKLEIPAPWDFLDLGFIVWPSKKKNMTYFKMVQPGMLFLWPEMALEDLWQTQDIPGETLPPSGKQM